jgi:hypothetical protein
MADIKIEGFIDPPSIATAHTLIGEIVHVFVGGEILSTGTPFFDFFRFARVCSIRERAAADRCCLHCGKSAQFAFEVVWESGFTDMLPPEVCEHCADGRVTDGGDLLSFDLERN